MVAVVTVCNCLYRQYFYPRYHLSLLLLQSINGSFFIFKMSGNRTQQVLRNSKSDQLANVADVKSHVFGLLKPKLTVFNVGAGRLNKADFLLVSQTVIENMLKSLILFQCLQSKASDPGEGKNCAQI